MLLSILKSVEIRHNFNATIVQCVDEAFKPFGLECHLDGMTSFIDVQDVDLTADDMADGFQDAVHEIVATFGASVVSLHF